MRICIVGKYPPIQGGVSKETYYTCHELAKRGHQVSVVTNCFEVEDDFRVLMLDSDHKQLEGQYENGEVKVYATSTMLVGNHIPMSNPFVSKMIGTATEVAKGCDVIVGWYLEPYGVVATIVGSILRKPVLLRHAGSDIGRLSDNPDLAKTYSLLMEKASGVITRTPLNERLIALGLNEEKLIQGRPSCLVPNFSKGHPFPDPELIDASKERFLSGKLPEKIRGRLSSRLNESPDPDIPTIGIYGKVGGVKGSYDLINALSRLAEQGVKFNFLSLVGGRHPGLSRYLNTILEMPALAEKTLILPFIAPWRVPDFLGACQATCFLERDFPITFHTPQVPREILASGSSLVLSREIANKQNFSDSLVDSKNVILVDPKDNDDLRKKLKILLTDQDLLRSVGYHGGCLSRIWEGQFASRSGMADAIESFSLGT